MPERRPRLEGKVAIVVGAGSSGPGIGNGKATSLLFAREGASVLLVDSAIERANETLAMIEEEGGTAGVFEADVTRADDCQGMVKAAIDRYGRLDILVNIVGILELHSVVDVEEEAWDRLMEVNVKTVVLSSKFAIPRMIEGGGGSIINISSIAGVRAYNATPYTTSKAAVNGLTMSMANDHGRDNVRVNAIAPGAVYTPMVAGLLSDEQREKRRESSMLGTEGTGWDVGWAAVYLASEESRWVTGTVLTVDAGITGMVPRLL
ncbi:MAG: SDR family oxidoreductase [Chloroflexi bacterium]|nr:SDR family oxidoreductase [Chloroflexota bacterium]